ncbi:hypothetical protein HCN44_001234 [Aphidius gifuensis]|uniref:Uncharacterized protein n=1 Tax=Aphidius gifuensis TaxID=684658 RepID=A0A834XL15_APHGI|nr:protein PAT1 homolog 1 isoform X2 [Aphidius gifuensis]KAF7988661.1 hypothetical protein HCN44_001234 [Aphidius gifuensis]
MADSFFGFDTSNAAIECPIDEELEELEYDALNDETFGSDALAGDWEQDHEKLSHITELTRPSNQSLSSENNKNGDLDVDVEGSLSHLVLDEQDGIVPRPGVWDSPNFSLTSSHINQHQLPPPPPPSSLPVPIKNVCTVEELERGLIRPPPGLIKPLGIIQTPQLPSGQFIIDFANLPNHLSSNIHQNIINGIPPTRFPPGLNLSGPHQIQLSQNIRMPNQLMQNARPMQQNQPGNIIRFPLPPHHLLLANQRQPLHGNFIGNYSTPQQPQPRPPPIHPQFLRQDHPLVNGPFGNSQNHLHLQQQQHHQHQQQQQHHQHQQQQHSGNQRNQQGEQQPNNQPFFKNNQFWNQNRNNPRYHQRQHHQNHNGFNENGEYDEYSGLMSNREKQWLINIQLLQHNTNQPFIDDFYFTVFTERQNRKKNDINKNDIDGCFGGGKDKKQNNNNNGLNRDSKDKDQHIWQKIVYTPTQFENSLGKLQCGSVTAPRKIIDMDVVSNNESGQSSSAQQKDMKKIRQRLLEIERLYTIQLKLEDVNNPLAILAEKQQAEAQQQQQQNDEQEQQEPKEEKKTAPELINIMFESLLQLMKEDKLSGILSVRKGKTLLLRFLPFLSVTEYDYQLGEFWIGFIRNLAIFGRRDTNLLVRFFPEFHRWLETVTSFSILLKISKSFMDSINQNNKINNSNLIFAVTNKFGVSVIASLLEQAENYYPDDENLISEWSIFILNLVEVAGLTPPCVAPFQPIAANTLHQHLQRINNLKSERYERLELLLTDANSA